MALLVFMTRLDGIVLMSILPMVYALEHPLDRMNFS